MAVVPFQIYGFGQQLAQNNKMIHFGCRMIQIQRFGGTTFFSFFFQFSILHSLDQAVQLIDL
jgi:hypothetical protein